MFPILRLLVILFIFTNCAYGPKRENDTTLSYLNGENYKGTAFVFGVPVVERQAALIRIEGQLVVEAQPLPIPLKHQTLVLKKGRDEVQEMVTDDEGTFRFAGSIPNGRYTIQLLSKNFKAHYDLEVDKYELKGLRIVAERAKSQ